MNSILDGLVMDRSYVWSVVKVEYRWNQWASEPLTAEMHKALDAVADDEDACPRCRAHTVARMLWEAGQKIKFDPAARGHGVH